MASYMSVRCMQPWSTGLDKVGLSSVVAPKEILGESCLRFSSLTCSSPKSQAATSRRHRLAPVSALPDLGTVALGATAFGMLAYSIVALKSGISYAPEDEKVKKTLSFFVHDIRTGPEPCSLLSAGTGNGDLSKLAFGSSLVFDNEVREGPLRDSSLLGRERGYGIVTDLQGKEGLQLVCKITFNEKSKYNGTLTFVGNVAGPEPISELLVMGGTGDFRGVRGYALVETATPNPPDFLFYWNVYLTD